MARIDSFLKEEKKRQARLKLIPGLFTEAARPDGPYSAGSSKRPNPPTYPFCLPVLASSENLFPAVRDQVGAFAEKRIPWHKGVGGGPTTHLCSSQVCCVNFLAPFSDRPDTLLGLAGSVFPEAAQMVPVDAAGAGDHVEFEWIGDPRENYLGEAGKSGRRTRGANCTSADAALRFRDGQGAEHVVLIEWKYCESYRDLDKIPAAQRLLSIVDGEPTEAAKTRRARYEHRLASIVDLPPGVTVEDLCVEPLYQLMRQQLLAHEMEQAGEAASVAVLHLSPRANRDFPRVTSPGVRKWLGDGLGSDRISVTEAWRKLLKHPEAFHHLAVEDFFSPALTEDDPALAVWRAYASERYSWATGRQGAGPGPGPEAGGEVPAAGG